MKNYINHLLLLAAVYCLIAMLPSCRNSAKKFARETAESITEGSSRRKPRSEPPSSALDDLIKEVTGEVVSEVTQRQLKKIFDSIDEDRRDIDIQITNDYDEVIEMYLTFDGSDWVFYELYPGDYILESSYYGGIIGVNAAGDYFIVAQSYRFYASTFY